MILFYFFLWRTLPKLLKLELFVHKFDGGIANNAIILLSPVDGESKSFNDITIGLWVKTATNESFTRTITDQYYNDGAGLNDYGCQIFLVDGKININAIFGTQIGNTYNSNFQSGEELNSTSFIADDEWHHIAFTARKTIGSGGEHGYDFKLYIDGFLEDSKSASRTISGYTDHRLIGDQTRLFLAEDNYTNNNLNSAGRYQDKLDDIKIFESVLTPSEILTLAENRSFETIYVDQNATGNNDGSSWENAFTDLQTALGYGIIAGDTIFIAEGVYTPSATGNREQSFVIADEVSVFGGFAGTETSIMERDMVANPTVLSGDLLENDADVSYTETTRSDNSYNVVKPGKNVVIDGFTISGGHAMREGNTVQRTGGAIVRIHGSAQEDALLVQNCIIKDNTAWAQAAGIYCDFRPAGQNTSVTINNCEFYNNISTVGSAVSVANRSAGLLSFNNTNCLYHNNRIENASSRDGLAGSALFLFSIAANSNLRTNLTNVTIVENIDNGTGNGGAAPIAYRVNNAAAKLYLEVYNSIIDQPSTESPFALQSNSSTQKMDELIILNSRISEETFGVYSRQEVTEFLTDATPNFTDIDNSDFTLVGDNNNELINTGDNSFVTMSKDLVGNTRLVGSAVDMGAYEFQGTVTSLTNASNQSATIYPNPAKDVLYTPAGNLEIYDATGQVILSKQTEGVVDISSLSAGIYFVKINQKVTQLIVE